MSQACPEEPWGRYSASGGLYYLQQEDSTTTSYYLYSFGGDTRSDADGLGGIVRTNFRFSFQDQCWEQLAASPVEIGYRATATQLGADPDSVWVLFGADRSGRAADQIVWQYSLSQDTWTNVSTTTILVDETNNSTPSVDEATMAALPPASRWKHAAVALDDHRILVTGGRQGQTVHSDVWIFDTIQLTWSNTVAEIPPMYRHGMALDTKRNVIWLYGGLDDNLSRYQSQLWQLNLTSMETVQIGPPDNDNVPPPSLASHAMEYVAETDMLLLWGGTCSDDSELHVYDIVTSTWCRIFPSNRPDRRDAMLWSLQYPLFYVAQGDSICYNFQVLTLSDVHVLDLSTISDAPSWNMIYEPYNSRGTGNEPYCNGNNAGNCQPQPLLEDTGFQQSTCSADILTRLSSGDGSSREPLFTPTPSPSSSTEDGTTNNNASSGGHSISFVGGTPVLLLVLVIVKLLGR